MSRFRQVLLCALPAALNSGAGPAAMVFTASEKGTPSFAAMVIAAGATNDSAAPSRDFSDRLTINNMLFKNRIEFLKGRGVGGNPPQAQNMWCPRRAIARWTGIDSAGVINTGDTLAILAELDNAGLLGANTFGTAACAFMPANPSIQASKPGAPFVPVGAQQLLNLAPGANGQLVHTFDEDGVADLSNAALGGVCQPGAVNLGNDPLESLTIEGITLPDRDNLIVGQGAVSAPGLMWSEDRPFNFFSPGLVEVSAGSQVVWQVTNRSAQQAVIQGTIPFSYYPGGRKSVC